MEICVVNALFRICGVLRGACCLISRYSGENKIYKEISRLLRDAGIICLLCHMTWLNDSLH